MSKLIELFTIFNSYKAIKAQSKEEVTFNIYEIDHQCSIKDKAVTSLNEIKSTVNMKHIQDEFMETEAKKLHLIRYFYHILTITEPMKYQRIDDLNSSFRVSKGEKNTVNSILRFEVK